VAPRLDLLRGTLDLLVLQTLAVWPTHGVGVARRIQQVTRGTFEVGPGSLFPALHRLEEKGWVKSEWGDSENNRKAKFYRLTPAGRRQLGTATTTWERIAAAVEFSAKAVREAKS